jgi:hypothetical protein
LTPGIYEIPVADAAGVRIYSNKELVRENTDEDISNVLRPDPL